MAGLKQYYEHPIKSATQVDRSVKCSKLYGVVELEIEVTELLENISIALHYLQKLDLFSATHCELRIFQKDIAVLMDTVTNLKYKIQKTFKDITFREDIQYLASSRESICELSSREMANKQVSKEMDEVQNETEAFHRRFAAGSSIIASERQYLRQEKVKPKEKKQEVRAINPNTFEEMVQDSRCNHSESVNLSSYGFSNNSEIRSFPFSWKRRNVKKRTEQKT